MAPADLCKHRQGVDHEAVGVLLLRTSDALESSSARRLPERACCWMKVRIGISLMLAARVDPFCAPVALVRTWSLRYRPE